MALPTRSFESFRWAKAMIGRLARLIAVIGESDCPPDLYAIAEDVGRLAAEHAAGIVCGGLGGVMEAACKGASSAGGVAVGILPGPSKLDANPFVTVAIPTAMGEARNALVVRSADAVIAVGGKYGTLSEIGLALKMGKPLVGVRTWGLYREGQPVEAFPTVDSAPDAVDLALRLAEKGG